MSAEDDISQELPAQGPRSITPSTPIRMSIAKMIMVGIGVVSVATTGTQLFLSTSGKIQSVSERLDRHITDQDVHLDSKQYRSHGELIGTFDLNIAMSKQESLIDGLRRQIETLGTELHHPAPRFSR